MQAQNKFLRAVKTVYSELDSIKNNNKIIKFIIYNPLKTSRIEYKQLNIEEWHS